MFKIVVILQIIMRRKFVFIYLFHNKDIPSLRYTHTYFGL